MKITELFDGESKELSKEEVLKSVLEIEELMNEGMTFDEAVEFKIILEHQREEIRKHVEGEKHVFR
ncbi:hypothetical protein [Methanococcus sp. CF]